MASGSRAIGVIGPQHEDAVTGRAADDGDMREDRGERPDVVLEFRLRRAVRGPLHHHPAGGQVIVSGLVVLLRRDDRGAGALDRRRRVGDDDVEPLVRELEVVPAVRDDDPAIRIRARPGRRPGSTSGTSSGPTGRARRRRSGGPRPARDRNAVPMPKATTSMRLESGRAMSGRIGISFASMVSSVIDVPATQSSGVSRIWPAWTEAISSSVDSNSRPPTAARNASFGCAIAPGRSTRSPMTARTTTAAIGRLTGLRTSDQPEDEPHDGIDDREHHDDRRRADRRHQHERDDQAADDGADGVGRQERAGFGPRLGRLVPAGARPRSGTRCRASR